MNKCLICTARTDAFACKDCATVAQRQLIDMAELLNPHALDQRRAGVRGISYAHIGGRSAGDKPLPFNPRVGEAEQLAHGTLFSIWHELVDDEPSLRDHTPPNATTSALAAWLAEQVMEHLRWMPQCDDMFSDVRDKHREVMRLWDNPPEQTFIGTCGAEGDMGTCPEAVYADRGTPTARCRRCKSEHDVAARYAELAARCVDHLATLKELSTFLAPIHGERVRLRRLKYLTECGRLSGHGERPEWMSDGSIRKTTTYRIGDVLDLIDEDVAREQERKSKRRAKVLLSA